MGLYEGFGSKTLSLPQVTATSIDADGGPQLSFVDFLN